MIEDSERFFACHPDPETKRRGMFLIQVIRGIRDEIRTGKKVKMPRAKVATSWHPRPD